MAVNGGGHNPHWLHTIASPPLSMHNANLIVKSKDEVGKRKRIQRWIISPCHRIVLPVELPHRHLIFFYLLTKPHREHLLHFPRPGHFYDCFWGTHGKILARKIQFLKFGQPHRVDTGWSHWASAARPIYPCAPAVRRMWLLSHGVHRLFVSVTIA